ncbi:MAG TPA: NADH-quinone oxidoreductase subunit C [Stellaceae bacterium]|nr:NADH-quinone oxidoreductase subunit C [Stellaceae bacterium]
MIAAAAAPLLQPADLPEAVRHILDGGGRMVMVYAWWPAPDTIELRYLFASSPRQPFAMLRCRPSGPVPSLAPVVPLLGWYEREIGDLFGVVFAGHPEPRRLVLHESARPVLPPFAPDYPRDVIVGVDQGRRFAPEIEVAGGDVQQLPFGPVRADVVESAEFLFHYIGEAILHYQPRLFFKHRGMERRFEGLAPATAVVLAERVSGVGGLAHALAFCQAVEAACGCRAPPRARFLRALMAELERLYNHLHYLGHLAHTTTLKVGEAEGKYLEERLKQLNGRLTGSRLLRGLLTAGGLRRDLSPEGWLATALTALRPEIDSYLARLLTTGSHLDRLITTGMLDRQTALDQGATGPVARASGLDQDLRRDRPYAAYDALSTSIPLREAGDAAARFQVRIAEIGASLDLIQEMLRALPDGPVSSRCAPPPGGEGLGWCESPRGALFYAVHFDSDRRLARVKIKSPSFSNWRVFPFTVHETNMMDYAINEASFGLTIAGCDR